MRRDFSENRRSPSPSAIKLKGLGVPIGEVEPNATSTAANEGTRLELNLILRGNRISQISEVS
jgi:hypothetical protein